MNDFRSISFHFSSTQFIFCSSCAVRVVSFKEAIYAIHVPGLPLFKRYALEMCDASFNKDLFYTQSFRFINNALK
jgi:hypothetical protein